MRTWPRGAVDHRLVDEAMDGIAAIKRRLAAERAAAPGGLVDPCAAAQGPRFSGEAFLDRERAER